MKEADANTATARVSAQQWVKWRIPYFVAGGISICFVVGSIDLGIGTVASPGPGMWPLIVSIVLMVCCIIGLVVATGDDVESFGSHLVRPALGVSALSVFILLFPTVGLIITCVVVFLSWFRFLAKESWLTSVSLTVAVTIGAHLLFVGLLGAKLPPDLVAQLWGGR